VDEDVLAAFLRDEAETLRIVEPLDSTLCHDSNLSFGANPGCLVFRSPKVLPAKLEGKQKRRANWILARRVSRSCL
jgi:hypothetical protein